MANKEFKPYVPADKVTPEFTATSIIIGVLLAIIFGAANAYLGLRVGMTVSASIPAAVISMGVIRVIMKKDSILESNMVQTIGSAGESLAAGAIFTLPALFLQGEPCPPVAFQFAKSSKEPFCFFAACPKLPKVPKDVLTLLFRLYEKSN